MVSVSKLSLKSNTDFLFSLSLIQSNYSLPCSYLSQSLFWYCSLPRCVTSCVCLNMLSASQWLPKPWLSWRTDRQARVAWLWGWRWAVWGDGLWGWCGRAGAASQPLPGGDPDIRPWLLLDHCLYFVIDLLKAVPFHNSCRMCGGGGRDREAEKMES